MADWKERLLDGVAVCVLAAFGLGLILGCIWAVFGIIFGIYRAVQRQDALYLVAGAIVSLIGLGFLQILKWLWDKVDPWLDHRTREWR